MIMTLHGFRISSLMHTLTLGYFKFVSIHTTSYYLVSVSFAIKLFKTKHKKPS